MKKKIVFICSVLVITLEVFLYNFVFKYKITLLGDETIKIPLNSVYNDAGVVVRHLGKKTDKYNIISNLNTKITGKYEILYDSGTETKKRIIEVVDEENPVITLKGKDTVVVNYGKTYEDEGYTAYDSYDGNITRKVKVTNDVDYTKLGDYQIIYSVIDSSNNEYKVSRYVSVVDNEKPKIEIDRNINSYLIKGSSINLNNYKATDNFDGDLTDKVKVTGTVDTNKNGIYKVIYSVTDSNNNEEKLVTTINVQEKNTSGIPVLMYHWFYDDTKGEKPGERNSHNFISKTNWEKQLKYLKDSEFYFPTWQELIDYIDGKIELPKRSVILTDDDCVEEFFDIALPLSQQYEVPITSFCITWKEYWKKFVGQKYLEFESHTDDLHERKCKGSWDGAVMCTDYDTIYKDIKKSIEKVKNKYAFAYPFGHYNDRTIEALKNNGIQLAFTIKDGKVKKGADKYKLPRVRISRGTSIETYKRLVN